MHGQFIREIPENVDKNRTWEWLSKSDLKTGTEALLCAVQEQAIRINYVKHQWKTSESPTCRLYVKNVESSVERIKEVTRQCSKESSLRPL